jgi:hypothetical protein
MASFGRRSKANLSTAHPDLQRLFNEVVKHFDCSVTCGHRGKEAQNEAYHSGRSKVKWPDGNHNSKPSQAVDVIPYPVDWGDIKRFYMFVGFVRGIAASMNIKIVAGADWDGDTQVKDQDFNDLPHFELIN